MSNELKLKFKVTKKTKKKLSLNEYGFSFQELVQQKGFSNLNSQSTPKQRNTESSIYRMIIDDAVNGIINLPHERSIILGQSGRRVLPDRDGSINRVNYTYDEVMSFRNKFITAIHNHPSSTSFSPSDLKIAMLGELKELIVVSPKYTYKVSSKNGWNEDMYNKAVTGINAEMSAVMLKYEKLVQEKRISARVAGLEASHEFMLNVAKKYNLNYSREAVKNG
jgi:hypothetical protein